MSILENIFKWFKGNADNPYSKLVWLNPEESPFKIRTLDCRSLLETYASWTDDQSVAERMARMDFEEPANYRGKRPDNVIQIPCELKYRLTEKVEEGWVYMATEMEDKWNIYLLDGYFYFVRSWTGNLIYRAKVDFKNQEAIVSMIEVSSGEDEKDSAFVMRQVDYLVKSHIFGMESPVPIPMSVAPKPELIFEYATVFCGRWARYASYEDTIETCIRNQAQVI